MSDQRVDLNNMQSDDGVERHVKPIAPHSRPPASGARKSEVERDSRCKPAPESQRYIGADIARLLAIVGMLATHLIAITAGLPNLSGAAQVAVNVTSIAATGVAAPLFAVLGGMSMVLASRRLLASGRPGNAVAGILVRGGFIMLIGLLLALTDAPPVIVLVYYGLAMILAASAIMLPSWVIGGVAVLLAGGIPFLNAAIRSSLSIVNEGGSLSFESFAADPFGAFRALLLTGQYPALTWVVYMLAGILVARGLIRARQHQSLRKFSLVLLGVGVGVAALAQTVSSWVIANAHQFATGPFAGENSDLLKVLLSEPSYGAPFSTEPWVMLVATPHTGSFFDLLRTTAIAVGVIGLLTALLDGGGEGRKPGPVIGVLQAAGSAPLTIYSLHIVMTAVLLNPTISAMDSSAAAREIPWYAAGLSGFILQIAGVLLLGVVLYFAKRRGPLEALLSAITRRITGRPGSKE